MAGYSYRLTDKEFNEAKDCIKQFNNDVAYLAADYPVAKRFDGPLNSRENQLPRRLDLWRRLWQLQAVVLGNAPHGY